VTGLWIAEAEEKWLPWLKQQSAGLFSRTFLPSHGEVHHRRVWTYAKNLLLELEGIRSPITGDLVEGLICAVWFHDAGMARDRGPSHGRLGRLEFESALDKSSMGRPALMDEVLEAIEFHDDKEKLNYRELSSGNTPRILDVLSVADDTDAFGIAGVYRYTEIYLHRRAGIRDLGLRVLANARHRYVNVARSCRQCPEALAGLKAGYGVLSRFFDLFNQQLLVFPDPESCMQGPLGVVNLIHRECVRGRVLPQELHRQTNPRNHGLFVQKFFLNLRNELEQ